MQDFAAPDRQGPRWRPGPDARHRRSVEPSQKALTDATSRVSVGRSLVDLRRAPSSPPPPAPAPGLRGSDVTMSPSTGYVRPPPAPAAEAGDGERADGGPRPRRVRRHRQAEATRRRRPGQRRQAGPMPRPLQPARPTTAPQPGPVGAVVVGRSRLGSAGEGRDLGGHPAAVGAAGDPRLDGLHDLAHRAHAGRRRSSATASATSACELVVGQLGRAGRPRGRRARPPPARPAPAGPRRCTPSAASRRFLASWRGP